MRRIVLLAIVLFLTPLVSGCSDRIEHITLSNVAGVYWHEDSRYSFALENPDGSIEMFSPGKFNCGPNPVKIFRDVKQGDKMWVKYEKIVGSWNCTGFKNMAIHIRTAEDLGGASWGHGKFASSPTTIIK